MVDALAALHSQLSYGAYVRRAHTYSAAALAVHQRKPESLQTYLALAGRSAQLGGAAGSTCNAPLRRLAGTGVADLRLAVATQRRGGSPATLQRAGGDGHVGLLNVQAARLLGKLQAQKAQAGGRIASSSLTALVGIAWGVALTAAAFCGLASLLGQVVCCSGGFLYGLLQGLVQARQLHDALTDPFVTPQVAAARLDRRLAQTVQADLAAAAALQRTPAPRRRAPQPAVPSANSDAAYLATAFR